MAILRKLKKCAKIVVSLFSCRNSKEVSIRRTTATAKVTSSSPRKECKIVTIVKKQESPLVHPVSDGNISECDDVTNAIRHMKSPYRRSKNSSSRRSKESSSRRSKECGSKESDFVFHPNGIKQESLPAYAVFGRDRSEFNRTEEADWTSRSTVVSSESGEERLDQQSSEEEAESETEFCDWEPDLINWRQEFETSEAKKKAAAAEEEVEGESRFVPSPGLFVCAPETKLNDHIEPVRKSTQEKKKKVWRHGGTRNLVKEFEAISARGGTRERHF